MADSSTSRNGRFVFAEDGVVYHIPVTIGKQELVDFIYSAERWKDRPTMVRVTPTGKVMKVV